MLELYVVENVTAFVVSYLVTWSRSNKLDDKFCLYSIGLRSYSFLYNRVNFVDHLLSVLS